MTPGADTSQRQQSVIATWAQAWTSHDKALLLEQYADDCVHEDLPMKMVSRGRKELSDFVDFVFTITDDFAIELKACLSSGDRGASEWVITGTAVREIPGTFRAGQALRIRGASIFAFQDGRVHRQTDFWDSATATSQDR